MQRGRLSLAAASGVNVRITEVRARPASIPFPTPLKTSRFDIPAVDTLLVDVRTDQGISGLSWVFAFGQEQLKVLKAMVDDVAGLVRGEDALLMERLWQKIWRSFDRIGIAGVSIIGMSAIDIALWDIAGKVAGQPLYRLLGGYRPDIETYQSGGLWLHLTERELIQQAESYLGQGFTAMKLRLGRPDPGEDLQRARALRSAIGPSVTLMADVNQGWDVKTSIRMGRLLEELDLFWLEEPIPHHDVAGLAQIRAAVSTRICTGETNYTKLDFLRLLEAQAADVLMPDVMRTGGITEWRKVASLCEAYNLPVTPHLFTEVVHIWSGPARMRSGRSTCRGGSRASWSRSFSRKDGSSFPCDPAWASSGTRRRSPATSSNGVRPPKRAERRWETAGMTVPGWTSKGAQTRGEASVAPPRARRLPTR